MPKYLTLSLLLTQLVASSALVAETPTASVHLVQDIRPGASSSFPEQLVVSGDTLFFIANDGATGEELWISDGTEGGTRMVLDLGPGSANSGLSPKVDVDETLFLLRGGFDELWTSDGTAGGTQAIATLPTLEPTEFTSALGLLFFRQPDSTLGTELWRSDGTEEGTFGLEIVPGPNGTSPSALIEFQNRLFFSGRDASFSGAILTTDGTLEGTTSLVSGFMANPAVLDGTLYFRGGADGMPSNEPWLSDGTPEGTRPIKDIFPTGSSHPTDFFAVNDWVLFWATENIHGQELWRTDGTEEGTTLVKDIRPGPEGSTPFIADPTVFTVNGRAIFSADDGTHGGELWVTDGTPEGTEMLVDITPGPIGSFPLRFTEFAGHVYFTAETPEQGRELWRTDGTVEGTVMFNVRPGPDSFSPRLTATQDHLFLTGFLDATGFELWAHVPPLFADGFESGDTSRWSASTP